MILLKQLNQIVKLIHNSKIILKLQKILQSTLKIHQQNLLKIKEEIYKIIQ